MNLLYLDWFNRSYVKRGFTFDLLGRSMRISLFRLSALHFGMLLVLCILPSHPTSSTAFKCGGTKTRTGVGDKKEERFYSFLSYKFFSGIGSTPSDSLSSSPCGVSSMFPTSLPIHLLLLPSSHRMRSSTLSKSWALRRGAGCPAFLNIKSIHCFTHCDKAPVTASTVCHSPSIHRHWCWGCDKLSLNLWVAGRPDDCLRLRAVSDTNQPPPFFIVRNDQDFDTSKLPTSLPTRHTPPSTSADNHAAKCGGAAGDDYAGAAQLRDTEVRAQSAALMELPTRLLGGKDPTDPSPYALDPSFTRKMIDRESAIMNPWQHFTRKYLQSSKTRIDAQTGG